MCLVVNRIAISRLTEFDFGNFIPKKFQNVKKKCSVYAKNGNTNALTNGHLFGSSRAKMNVFLIFFFKPNILLTNLLSI